MVFYTNSIDLLIVTIVCFIYTKGSDAWRCHISWKAGPQCFLPNQTSSDVLKLCEEQSYSLCTDDHCGLSANCAVHVTNSAE